MGAEQIAGLAAGLVIAAISLLAFWKAEKLLPALAGPAVPPAKARRRWAGVGIFLLLLTVPVTVLVWRVMPAGPWPSYAFAIPSLPLVLPAWHCFKRAGWAATDRSGRGMSPWKLGCMLAALAMTLLFVGAMLADKVGLLG